jgi:hypothetical protein
MPCHAMHPMQDLFFWKVFHKYYNFIYTPICTKFYSCKKWVLQPATIGIRQGGGDWPLWLELSL